MPAAGPLLNLYSVSKVFILQSIATTELHFGAGVPATKELLFQDIYRHMLTRCE